MNLNAVSGNAESISLFENDAGWQMEPRIAFEALLLSDQFRFSNRSTMMLPANHRIQKGSAIVYLSMFDKFMRHLQIRDREFLDSQSGDFYSFFTQELNTASNETRARYSRLLERIFDHLCRVGLREDNPVSTWTKQNINTQSDQEEVTKAGPMIRASEVCRLQDWLYTIGAESINQGDWKLARDITLASVSLGTGMRCAELLRLTRHQVKYWPGGPTSDRFEFELPTWATVITARAHRTVAEVDCVGIMERWWARRWVGFGASETSLNKLIEAPKGKFVFPATLSGKPLTASTLYRNLKAITEDAIKFGILNNDTRWVLERGAQGLRRAFVLSSLDMGVPASLLTERLGHHHRRSVRRYVSDGMMARTMSSPKRPSP